MRPDVVFVRCDIEIANQNRFSIGLLAFEPRLHLVEEGELMGEFLVYLGVWFVAAGRDIEIVDRDIAVPVADRDRRMTGILLAAETAKPMSQQTASSKRSRRRDSPFGH